MRPLPHSCRRRLCLSDGRGCWFYLRPIGTLPKSRATIEGYGVMAVWGGFVSRCDRLCGCSARSPASPASAAARVHAFSSRVHPCGNRVHAFCNRVHADKPTVIGYSETNVRSIWLYPRSTSATHAFGRRHHALDRKRHALDPQQHALGLSQRTPSRRAQAPATLRAVPHASSMTQSSSMVRDSCEYATPTLNTGLSPASKGTA